MAITVTWPTRVINVQKADMTLVQSTPIEVRELDLDTFRLTLKDLEDSEEGMAYILTHNHVAPFDVGGITLARVVEIVNDYTVTFEDGAYIVNLVGANTNLADRVNPNNVSIRSSNSAGLVQTREIQYASFNGGVTLDVINGKAGTLYPIGTLQTPVNNLADALLIATLRGFNVIYIVGDATIDTSGDYRGYSFVGENLNKSQVTVSANAQVDGCEFIEMDVTGTLDGDALVRDCRISDLIYVDGVIERCILGAGTITLSGASDAHFIDCWSGVAGTGTPIIDMGGSGTNLGIRNYNGGIKITNKSGTDNVSVDINSGHLVLDSTVTNGTIVVRGIGKLTDNSVGATVNSDDLLSGLNLKEVHEEVFGRWVLNPTGDTMTLYKPDGVTVLKVFDLTRAGATVPDYVERDPQ